jgi:hypothetical protein
MSHRFNLGQAVVFSPGAREILNVATRCKITRLMPINWLRVFEGSEFGLSRLGRWIPEIGGKMRPEKLSDLRKPKLRRNRITSTDFWPFWAPGNPMGLPPNPACPQKH